MKRHSGLALALLLAVTLAVVPRLIERWGQEADTAAVTLLFDSRALTELAREGELSEEEWLRRLQRAGLTGLALWPETLEGLTSRGEAACLTRAQARTAAEGYPAAVQAWLLAPEEGLLVTVWSGGQAQTLAETLTMRGAEAETIPGESCWYLLLEGPEALAQLPLGFRSETVEAARALGLTLCPVLSVPEEADSLALARCLYQDWQAVGAEAVLCLDSALPGWTEDEEAAGALARDWSGCWALTETSSQQGSLDFPGKEAVAGQTGRLLRCFYQWDYVSDRYGALGYSDSQEVSLALARAAAERNCRLLWFRAMTDSETGETVTELAEYVRLLEALENDLARFGLSVGQAEPVTAGDSLPVLLAQLMAWAVAAGTGCLCAGLLQREKRGWGMLLSAQLTALLGGLAAAGWISGASFLLGESTFRGVKPAQLLPLGWFLLLWGREVWRTRREQVQGWLARPVLGREMLLGGAGELGLLLLAGVMAYYLARTGNSGLAADWELRLRNELEVLLTVRPRFKEFALGLPCLALWCWGRLPGWAEPLAGLGGMIGLVSVTNTFLHSCTPLRISLLRTGVGWLLGGLLALLAVGLARWGRRRLWPGS